MRLRVGVLTVLFVASQLFRAPDERPPLAQVLAAGLALGMMVVYGLPRLRRRGTPGRPGCLPRRPATHALLVHIPGPVDRLTVPLDAIESRLSHAIAAAGVGEIDGNLVGADDATLYMYGADADQLFAVAEPVLRSARLPTGTRAVKRYGEPGAREEHHSL